MKEIKQIELSPRHNPEPTSITRFSNGDLIVAGSSDSNAFHPWAVRFDAGGSRLWEYIDGGETSWGERGESGQRIEGAVELIGGVTFLCGRKVVSKRLTPFFTLLDARGTAIATTLLEPKPGEAYQGIACARFGDGIAIASTILKQEGPTSWLGKVDSGGRLLWEKYGDFYGHHDLLPTPDSGLIVVSNVGNTKNVNSVTRMDSKGDLVARFSLPSGSSRISLARAELATTEVRAVYTTADQATEVMNMDSALGAAKAAQRVENFSTQRAVQLRDGTVALFGSKRTQSGAVPIAAAILLSATNANRLLLTDPPESPGWIVDAVATNTDMEFAVISSSNLKPTLRWMSLR